MKKLFPLILAIAFAATSFAQTVGISVGTLPCNNDGILVVNMTGFTPPLTVTWHTSGTTGTDIVHTGVTGLFDALTGYSGGPVTVTVTDVAGVTGSGSFGGAAPFNFRLSSSPALCPAWGTDTAFVTGGGSAPFTYQWYNTSTSALAGTGNPISLPAGSYGVTITDAAGCVYGSKVDFGAGSGVIAYVSPFTDTMITTVANCTDGSATLMGSITGATLPVTYLWSNGATTPSITGLSMGNYEVVITDALGCKATVLGDVLQSITISLPFTTSPANCADTSGVVTVFPSGGTAPYSYIWTNGATTQTQTGLLAGAYGVKVTDAYGCIAQANTSVGSLSPISVTHASAPSLCTSPTGTATVFPVGGTGPYNVLWYTWPPQTGVSAASLPQGDYHYRVTDAMGCTKDGDVTIPPIDIISTTFWATNATCTTANGSLIVYPTGGVPPYHYSWSTGAITAGISSRPAGTYTVTITDNLGCKVNVQHDIPANTSVGVGLYTTPASCIFNTDGNIDAIAHGGTLPYSYHWSGGGTGSSLPSLPYGDYSLYVTDATGCTAANTTHVGYDSTDNCYCTISGTIFYDIDGNCLQDAGEPGIPHMQVHISGMGYTYTNDNGHYSYRVPSGSYTVSETVLPQYPLTACQLNNIAVSASTGFSGCEYTVDFANAIDSVHDMHISTWDYINSGPVPGGVYSQVAIITNRGSIPEAAIVGGYQPDAQIFPPSFTPAGVFNGASGWYSTAGGVPAINPGFSQPFYIKFIVPENIPVGTNLTFKDSVAYSTPIENWLTDNTPWDNINKFSTKVAGSASSNFKEVYPKGTGPLGLITSNDSVLEYMVHFRNTTAFKVNHVFVIDTLDNNLDWTSLSPMYISAPCQVTLDQAGPYKVAKFTFKDINLPGNTSNANHPHGMFTYTIKMKPGLPLGTQFRNRASIYCDEHTPVMTNVTLNTLGSLAPETVNSVSAGNSNSFYVYPNPAGLTFNTVINSNTAGTGDLKVSDVTGKVLVSKTLSLQKGVQTVVTDVSQMAPGIYFVSLNENGKVETQKLVIMK